MKNMIVSTEMLCPSVNTLYRDDLDVLSGAGEISSQGYTILNVPSILGRCGPNNKEIIILDGNHRAKVADEREINLHSIILETEEDCLNLPENLCSKITKNVLTKYGVLALFKNAYAKMDEMYALNCRSVSDIKIEDGTFFEKARHRGFDLL